MRLRAVMFAALVLTGTTAAGATPGNAAVRFGLRLESATVLAGGTAIDVHYVAVCPPGALARVGVSLAQRTGAHVAVGAGATELVCNGVPRSVLLRVVSTGARLSFRPGRARADASLLAATGLGLSVQDDQARLVIRRR